MNALMKAVNVYLEDSSNVEGIADTLKNVDLEVIGDKVSPEFNTLYETLMSKVGPQLATSYYNTGYDAYKAKKYEEAIANLSKACQYDENNVNAFYNLANSYYQNGDIDKAKEKYNEVITKFPDTQSAKGAETKLAEINNKTGD